MWTCWADRAAWSLQLCPSMAARALGEMIRHRSPEDLYDCSWHLTMEVNAAGIWAHYCSGHAWGFTCGSNSKDTGGGPWPCCQRGNGSMGLGSCCPKCVQAFICTSSKRVRQTKMDIVKKASFLQGKNYLGVLHCRGCRPEYLLWLRLAGPVLSSEWLSHLDIAPASCSQSRNEDGREKTA